MQVKRSPSTETLIDHILHNPSPVIKESFRYPATDVYFIRPEPTREVELKDLINDLDQDINARKPFQTLDYLTDGPSIVTLGGVEGKKLHERVTQSLTHPLDYIRSVIKNQKEYYQQHPYGSLHEMVKWPLLNTLGYGLLGIEGLNLNFQNAIKSFDLLENNKDDDLRTSVFYILSSMSVKNSLSFLPGGTAAREQYQQAVMEIFNDIIPLIKKQIQDYIDNNKSPMNVVTLSIFSLLKNKSPQDRDIKPELSKLLNDKELCAFLEHRYLRTLPAIVQPGVNISHVVERMLLELNKNDDLNQQLQYYLEQHKIDKHMSAAEIKQFIERDDRENGILSALYCEALRMGPLDFSLEKIPSAAEQNNNHTQTYDNDIKNSPPLIKATDPRFKFFTWRYTTKKISYAGYDIPKNSVIAIADVLPHFDEQRWEKPFEFNINRFFNSPKAQENKKAALLRFGNFDRLCPANKIAPYIAKTALIGFFTQYQATVAEEAGNPTLRLNRTS